MTTCEISYSDGRTDEASSYADAIAIIRAEYPDAVTEHDGDLSDGGDRTLCWENAASSENDDGANAVATMKASYKVETVDSTYRSTNATEAARVAVAQRRNGRDPSVYAVVDCGPGAGVSVRRAEIHGTIRATAAALVAAAN